MLFTPFSNTQSIVTTTEYLITN